MMGGAVQGISTPPQLSTISHALTAAVSMAAPAQSMRASRACRCSRRSARSHSTMATSATGRLIQNIQRHENASVTQPPMIGPATEASPHVDAMYP
jgi:hypothetical protein